ncbi:T9SS type A sorting domain-containing protein [Psychroflexus torquis]|uniref:T9SS type A sorting domain-containing protein n=1 Tax=Psychroflexus torquis TaxID=57029 RepID=UPI0012FAAF53|nr:T9SS type A sorting domain-containing protein [Psychroflexus torquis]
MPSSGEVVLIDNYLETRTQLNQNSNIYSFNLDPILPESENVNRFELGFENITLGTTTPQEELAFLSLYPNPTTGLINIDLKEAGEALENIKIFSTDGKLVKQINIINNSTEQIDVSDLSRGFYLVELQTANSIYVEKLILN